MTESVTAVTEDYTVALAISYSAPHKLHVVAELFRHRHGRRFSLDVQSHKTAIGANFDEGIRMSLSTVFDALSAPTTGADLKLHKNTLLERFAASVPTSVWLASHRGLASTKAIWELWVSMV